MNDTQRMKDNLIAMVKGRINELTRQQQALIEEARECGDAILSLQAQLKELEGQ